MTSYARPVFSPVILLTATIDPKGMTQTRRTDPRVREQDYLEVIRFLLKTVPYPIVFCENSGYDLSKVHHELAVREADSWEVLACPVGEYPRTRGKGYGELLVVRYALGHSKLVANASHVIKITGRYTVANILALLTPLENQPQAIALADYKRNQRYAYSGFFAATPTFISTHLAPLQDYLDDSQGHTMEVALQKALVSAENDGEYILPFPEQPMILGVSGTWNVEIAKDNPHSIVFSLPKARMLIRAYWRGFLRRIGR